MKNNKETFENYKLYHLKFNKNLKFKIVNCKR
jgi:hypothetical protein